MSTTDSFVDHRLDQSYELVTAAKTSSPTSFFSLPIELRIDIYERVVGEEEYEIHEFGLPPLLRTRLQTTREFYQLCRLRVALVEQRKSDKKRKRLLENIENTKKHGTCYDRRDFFVHIRIEEWCSRAALYQKASWFRRAIQCSKGDIRPQGKKCNGCKIMSGPGQFSLALLFVQLTGLITMFIFGICLGVLNALPSGLQRPLLVEFCTDHRAGIVVCGKAAIIAEEMLMEHIRPSHHFVSTGMVAFTFSPRFF